MYDFLLSVVGPVKQANGRLAFKEKVRNERNNENKSSLANII